MENDCKVLFIDGVDLNRAYKNVDRLFDCIHSILIRFVNSPRYFDMLHSDFIDHPSSNCASWEEFRDIVTKHLGVTTVRELLKDDEDEIEHLCWLMSKDFSLAYERLVFWQIDRAYNKLQELRTLLFP